VVEILYTPQEEFRGGYKKLFSPKEKKDRTILYIHAPLFGSRLICYYWKERKCGPLLKTLIGDLSRGD